MEQVKEARIRIESPRSVSAAGPLAMILQETPSRWDYGLLFLAFVFSGLSLYLSFFAG